MKWQEFVNKCEEVKSGSGKKLERIKKNKEGGFDEKDILEKKFCTDILESLFYWSKTKEPFDYWYDLCELLRFS